MDLPSGQSSNTLAVAHKVLVVDDNEHKRQLLSCILEKNDLTVLEAENGRIALKMLEQTQPDVVLLDVLMPGIDGFEVCRRMKANPKTADIPVLFVTVLDQDRNRIAGLELGGEDFLNWPINAAELMARIHSRIRSRHPLRQLRNVVKEQEELLEENRKQQALTEYELEQARLVQNRFLTHAFPQDRGLTFVSYYNPSRQVGGDLFDVVPLDSDQVVLLMADVSGHGLPAALLTAVTKVLFRSGVEQHSRPGQFLYWLNRQISAYLAAGEFLTAFVGLWNAETHLFSFASGGHPPPLVVGSGGSDVKWLRASGGVIGATKDVSFSEGCVELTPGQRVICYTDGMTEATNANQELFGEDRFAAVCTAAAVVPLQNLAAEVVAAIASFTPGSPYADDQAMLAAEVTG